MQNLNKIIQADCLEYLKSLPDGCVDLVLTSPPYDNIRTYNSNEIFSFNFFCSVAKELTRVLKVGGVICWVTQDQISNHNKSGNSFRQALFFQESCQLNFFDNLIYSKNGITYPNTYHYYACFEYIMIFSKGKPKSLQFIEDRKNSTFNKKVSGNHRERDGKLKECIGSKKKRKIKEYGRRWNIWTYEVGYSKSVDKLTKQHPAVMPIKLCKDLMYSFSQQGDTVLDCFSGSGTTALASIQEGRNFLCCERDEKYVKIANDRLTNWQEDLLRQDKWLEDRGVVDFESDVREEVK